MHDIAVWYYAAEFIILQIILAAKSYDAVGTLNFYDILKTIMISYMILDMKLIFQIK